MLVMKMLRSASNKQPASGDKKIRMITEQEDADMKNAEKTPAQGLNVLMVDDDEICLFIQRRVLDLS